MELRTKLGASLLVVLALAAARAEGQAQPARAEPVVRQAQLENPAALGRFHQALANLRAGKTQRARVLHFGDSHVAADHWTAVVRTTLQARYGHGGFGYMLPGPNGSRHDRAVSLRLGPGWDERRRGFARDFGPVDGLWGVAGVALEATQPGAWVRLRTPALEDGGILEIHLYSGGPGAELVLAIDGHRAERLNLAPAAGGLIRVRRELGPGRHTAVARVARGRGVRLLGVVLEHSTTGVVYDVLGINGHRVSAILDWNPRLLAAQLAQRQPDLLVFSYGANEGLATDLPLSTYGQHLRQAVARMRGLCPRASCLLVGPVATCPDNPRITRVGRLQQQMAAELGCAYWDSSAVSGGPGSLCEWMRAPRRLAARDGLHLTRRGYEVMGRQLASALLPQ